MKNVTFENITIWKARGKKNDNNNAENVKETNIVIGELLPAAISKK